MRSSILPILVLCALLSATASTAQVVINEIMYVPNAPEPEWVEVFNMSDTAVSITNWTVQDRTTARPAIPSGIVPAKGYLVLARDTNAFRTARPSATSFALVQVAIPSLNNTGDDFILRDARGKTIDSVSWSSSWGGTGGISLERITETHPANERQSWKSALDSTGATPGRRNSVAPAARDLAMRSLSFNPDTKNIRIVIGNVGVERSVGATVSLYYDANNDTLGTPEETQAGRDIPQMEPGDSLLLFLQWKRPLTVEGERGLLIIDHPDDERPTDNVGTVSVREKFVDTGVIVNEFIYAPAAPEPEWVELKNRGEFPVDLTGWVLHDAGASRPKIGSAILLPGDYLVLTKDTAELREAHHIPSSLLQFSLPSLNNGNDNIVLRNSNGIVVDSIGYRSSWGGSNGRSVEKRMPGMNGHDSASWGSSLDPARGTPGRQNSLVPPKVNLGIGAGMFNQQNGTVEVVVANTGTLSVSGGRVILYRDENSNGLPEMNEQRAAYDLPPINPSDSTTATFLWDAPLTLKGEVGVLLLQLERDERPGDDTARIVVRQPTVDTGLIVNEIMYDPNDPEPEWIEAYNRGSLPVDLAGWRIGDASGNSGPLPSEILSPGEYILVTPDTVALKAVRDISSRRIRLLLPAFNNSGDAVVLRNPSGIAIDSFRYASGWGGKDGVSLERNAFDLPSTDPASWTSTRDNSGGTPGAKNSWEPILRDLALGTITFDADAVQATVTLYNRGLEAAVAAEAILYFDADVNGLLEPDEELHRTAISSLPSNDSVRLSLRWPRPLTIEGEEGIIELILANDQRPESNVGKFRVGLPPTDTGVVVNEIMYDPNSPEVEWLEVYNRGSLPVQLKGWTIRDGSTSSGALPEFTLLPGAYTVLTSDSAELRRLRGIPTAIIQVLHPAFNNSGDSVLLINPSGKRVDQFAYTSSWGGNDGSSLERKDFGTTGTDPQHWRTSTDSTKGTPGRANSTPLPEKNIALQRLLFDPITSTISIVVRNTGEETTTAAEAILYYDVNRDGLDSADEELSRTPLSAIPSLDSVGFSVAWPRPLTARGEAGIILLTMDGDRNAHDNSRAFTARTLLGDNGILVNEFMYAPASPETEWIELMNTGTLPVDLAGWSIGDAVTERTLPEAIIEPGTYLVLTADTTALRSHREEFFPTLQLPLPSLNNNEDAIIVRNGSGGTVDSLYYFASWGGAGGRSLERRRPTDRGTDSTSWRSSLDSAGATPGRENSVLPPARNIALDSISFDRASGSLIAHVRNGGNEEIANTELILYYDRNENSRGETAEELDREDIPALSPDGTAEATFAWPRLLTDEGEIVLIDARTEGDMVEEDNGGEMLLQRLPLDTGLVISEIMFDPLPYGEFAGAEYLEVYNPNNRPIPLAGWRVADGSGEERILPEHAPFVTPGAFAVVAADSGIYHRFPFLQDSTNVLLLGADLGMNNTGDDALLRNPHGRVIDSVRYSDSWHWNQLDDTKGIALERLTLSADANDPFNWSSSVAKPGGTPGAPNSRAVAVPTFSADLATDPQRVSPDGDGFEDFTRISYKLPTAGGRVVLSIYDRHGRRVARPLNNELAAPQGDIIWDGTDDDGRPLPIGIYVLRMELYPADGSGTKTAQSVITVARRL